MAVILWIFLVGFFIIATLFLAKKIQKSCAIHDDPPAPAQPPSPENTIIVFDIHGVLFHHHYTSMLKQSVQTGLLFKIIPCLFNVCLLAQALRLLRTRAVPEAYMVGLANQFPCLKPYSSISITIANTQIPQHAVWHIVRSLKKQGYTLHILSNIGQTVFEDLRTKHPEIFSQFDAVMAASPQQEYQGKPRAHVFKKYLSTYNPESKQVIFIDDKPKNTKASLKFGMSPIFFCCAEHLQEKLAVLGVHSATN